MTAPAFWLLFYWVTIPLALIAGVVSLVHSVRAVFEEPTLDGRLLFHATSVRARSHDFSFMGRYTVWITDRELVIRPRWDYTKQRGPLIRRYSRTGIERFVAAPGDPPTIEVYPGRQSETRCWTFEPEEPALFLRALETLCNGPTPAPSSFCARSGAS